MISLNSKLYQASVAASPKLNKQTKKKKRNLPLWNDEIAVVVKRSKIAHSEWKAAGCPKNPISPYVQQKKTARSSMRRVIRQQVYLDKQDKYNQLMRTHDTDMKTFFRLVNRQQSIKTTATDILQYGGETHTSEEKVAEAFSEHFQKLATPADKPDYDEKYKLQVSFDRLLMEFLAKEEKVQFKPVIPKEKMNIIRSFKNNKAQDIYGISAEHLKLAPDLLFRILALLMNTILDNGYVPPQLKQGVLTPVLKKKKDATLPTNYRGITVLSIIGKVLERVLQNRTTAPIDECQSRLQRGFTNKSSAINAALILSETQNEAKENGHPLKLVTLDACKAFDVVWQDSLLRKLYNIGIHGSLWLSMSNLYSDATSVVKWQGRTSSPFEIKQGVRQGGILSTMHYKLFINDLLLMLQRLGVGITIGHIDCSAPTCADDVALLAAVLLCLQLLLYIVKYYIDRERYGINAQKSAEVDLAIDKTGSSGGTLTLGGEPIEPSPSEVHLGVDRNLSGTIDIAAKIQTGRRTMYALMGAGAYGCSGVTPPLVAHLWKIYALPRMTYGLEVFELTAKEVHQLEKFQRSTLRLIQNFPINTAICAVYGLLGIRPMQQELDLRKLTLLGNVLSNRDSIEYQIAQRQLAVKSLDSKSWFSSCNRLLYKYGLPNLYNADKTFESMEKWKSLIKRHIDEYVRTQWLHEPKFSLKYLNIQSLHVGEIHQSLRTLPNDVRTVKRAYPKLRLLTGTYILQENRAKFNQYKIDDTCTLCRANAETRVHFLVECSRFSNLRQGFIQSMRNILKTSNTKSRIDEVLTNPEKATQLILDSSVHARNGDLFIDTEMTDCIEKISRNMCYNLHKYRCDLLSLKLK